MGSKTLLVGDNPFHNISHLSQERSRERTENPLSPTKAADLVNTALDNGADGFMFSVSKTTLSILEELRKRREIERIRLYPLMPYAYEYVRFATQSGGFLGLAKRFGQQLLFSQNLGAVASGLRGILGMNPESVMRMYLTYEICRINSSAGRDVNIESVILHEVVTDLALALDLKWLFDEYSKFLRKRDIIPGFNTCNFPFLIRKLREWSIDVDNMVVATPFNQIGFQMNPSKRECEETLTRMNRPVTIAISVLAAGYLKLPQAIDYIAGLPNIKGMAIGISKDEHARQTFRLARQRLQK